MVTVKPASLPGVTVELSAVFVTVSSGEGCVMVIVQLAVAVLGGFAESVT
jgi:hypothetical protein